MNLALSTLGGPSYFVPSSVRPGGVGSAVDYRGGPIRDLVQALFAKLSGVSYAFRAGCAPLLDQWEHLSGSARMEAYASQFEVIERLRAVPVNWSTSSATLPSAEQVRAAQMAVIGLYVAGVPAPSIMLLDEGTLGCFWRRQETYVSIDFDADGEFPWTAAVGPDVMSGIWAGGELPEALREAIGQ